MNIFSKIKFSRARGKERLSVGLDIGTQSIKCVKLKINGAIELVDFSFADGGLDPSDVLKKIKGDMGIDLVNISFCGSSTVIRFVNFLKMNKAELNQALKFEAQKHIPFSLSEVNLDAAILKDDLPENKMLVLLAAIKKELLQQRLKVLENAALMPNILDIDSLALVNAFNFNYPKIDVPENKSVCLLNIGAAISNLSILDNGMPRLSRDIHSAGANFTKKLMDIFGLNFAAAEALKIMPQGGGLASDSQSHMPQGGGLASDSQSHMPQGGGLASDSQSHMPSSEEAVKVKAGVESVLTELAAEIRTSFDYYESQHSSSVAKIFLSGGGSKISGLSQMLSVCLGIPVETWDAFKQIKISDKIDTRKLNNFSGQFNVAVGLALRC